MIFHRSKPTDFERLLERQRLEFPTHYDDHDTAVDQLLANKPEFRVNADSDGSGIPTIPKEVMDKLLAMDINKSYFTRPSSDEIQAFLGLDGEGESTDAYAFYLPFHFYFNWWGIYIFPDGVRRTNARLRKWYNAMISIKPRMDGA